MIYAPAAYVVTFARLYSYGHGYGHQKVLSKPSADSFAVGRSLSDWGTK
jgi:hypothetical protein